MMAEKFLTRKYQGAHHSDAYWSRWNGRLFAFPVKSDDGCLALFNEGGSGTDLKWDLSNAALLRFTQSPGERVKRRSGKSGHNVCTQLHYHGHERQNRN